MPFSFKLILIAFVSLSLIHPVYAQQISDANAPESAGGFSGKKALVADQFMVVAAHPRAVAVGYQVLKQGGSAIDAMVAVQVMLGLVEPQSSGLGGGALLVYYHANTQTLTTFDGRETAPLQASPELFLDAAGKPLSFFDAVVGGRSVGTPGTVKLLGDLHQAYGRRPWAELLKPTISLAKKGFVVSPRLAGAIANDQQRLSRYPQTREYFFTAAGKPLPQGYRLKNISYARSLETLAKKGADYFYTGPIAQSIIRQVNTAADNPGVLSQRDFDIYTVKQRQAVCAPYKAYRVCGMGPPSSGALTIGQILGMVSHFDLHTKSPDDLVAWQVIGDASRLAFADRGRYMADTDFVPMPEGLLDKDYLQQRAQLIVPGQALAQVQAGSPPWALPLTLADDESLELPSTTHISIVDADGNIVSMTSTIENGFGSRLMSNGFLLNNELTDFSFRTHKDGYPIANRVEPGKRPRSSMAPTIVFKGDQPILVIGSPGGSRIIGYVASTIIAYLDWKLPLQEAINLPHLVNRFGTYDVEQGTVAEQWKTGLEELGFTVSIRDLNSGLHGIAFEQGKLVGAADPRREGLAMGD
ncbi:MAG: gamma-glutamyltransferase [Pseudomonadota bacterium]